MHYQLSFKLTNEQLKNQIFQDFYSTGRINGYYFKKKSKSKANPVKHYIKMCLNKTTLIQFNTATEQDLIEEIYQEAFIHVYNYPTEKFLELYNGSELKGSRIIALTLRIIILKCFSSDKRTGNPKHSYLTRLGFGSGLFTGGNYFISPFELHHENPAEKEQPELIIYDDVQQTEFEEQYGFSPDEILSKLSPESKFVFEKLLEKQKIGAPSKERIKQKEQLANEIKAIREVLKND